MDPRYELYCLNDRLFYDSPKQDRGTQSDFAFAERPVPPGWTRTEQDDWLVYWPPGASMPAQGWKAHSSAGLDNAEAILEVIADYCTPRRIPFKFIRNRRRLLMRNAKSADRFASGKFVTIYPADEAELETLLTELGDQLAGQAGPTILSDLRWGEGPLHVRYGGFTLRYTEEPGEVPEPAIEDAEGKLVPDRRGPFAVPPWIELPAFLRPHLDARNSNTIADLPYDIVEALHFSNGGGVYLGKVRDSDEQVVIKEGRPHAGLSIDEADAVARLEREREALEHLAGLAVPAVRGTFTAGEHHFLVQEYVEGETLHAQYMAKYPLIDANCDEAKIADYTAWAVDMCGTVERAAQSVHERGIVSHDLHPANMIVRKDGSIAFIDWEIAAHFGEGTQAPLGSPGFAAPAGTTGQDADLYALACLRLWLFLPLTMLIRLDPGMAERIGEEICRIFPVPHGFVEEAVATIDRVEREAAEEKGPLHHPAGGPPPPENRGRKLAFEPSLESWPELRDGLVRAILASATPERDDRLFPGDIAQFGPGGGVNFATGAAGVLYALEMTGAGRFPEHEEWLLGHTLDAQADAAGPMPIGFYDGLSGVAYVLDRLGRRSDALAILEVCTERLGRDLERQPIELYGGLAGIGLNLAHFAAATGDGAFEELAQRCAEVVADRIVEAAASEGRYRRAGLFHGASGPALLFLRRYEASGDPALLELAESAIDQDLARCVLRDDGTMQTDEGWRTLPYLGAGSIGIGMVIDLFLAHRPVERFNEAAAAIRKAGEGYFYIQPNLANGLAGIILARCRQSAPGSGWQDPVTQAQLRRLARYVVPYGGGWAIPGEQLLRLSMDLTTGTAGLTVALGAGYHESPVHLPFLGPPGHGGRDRREQNKGKSDVDPGPSGAAAC